MEALNPRSHAVPGDAFEHVLPGRDAQVGQQEPVQPRHLRRRRVFVQPDCLDLQGLKPYARILPRPLWRLERHLPASHAQCGDAFGLPPARSHRHHDLPHYSLARQMRPQAPQIASNLAVLRCSDDVGCRQLIGCDQEIENVSASRSATVTASMSLGMRGSAASTASSQLRLSFSVIGRCACFFFGALGSASGRAQICCVRTPRGRPSGVKASVECITFRSTRTPAAASSARSSCAPHQ
jgi:hypothetical protein